MIMKRIGLIAAVVAIVVAAFALGAHSQSPGFQYVPSSIPAGRSAATVWCPEGDHVSGGGANLGGQDAIAESYPREEHYGPDLYGWHIRLVHPSSQRFTAWAVCEVNQPVPT